MSGGSKLQPPSTLPVPLSAVAGCLTTYRHKHLQSGATLNPLMARRSFVSGQCSVTRRRLVSLCLLRFEPGCSRVKCAVSKQCSSTYEPQFSFSKVCGQGASQGLVTPKNKKACLRGCPVQQTSASSAQQAERILILDNSERKQRLNTVGWKVTEATPCVTRQRTNGRTALSRRTTLAKVAPRVCESKIPSEVSWRKGVPDFRGTAAI